MTARGIEDRSKWKKICPTCMEAMSIVAVGTICSCGETSIREGDDRPDNTSLAWNSTGRTMNVAR